MSAANRASTASEMRALVAALLTFTGHKGLVESARSCTSELVANVYRHTNAALVHVEVTLAPTYVTVYVYDDRPRVQPVPPEYLTLQEQGMGLKLVTLMSDAWGVTVYGGAEPHSKAVWFKMNEGGKGASA
ncbi:MULTISPECIES: ATP-binding protein [unclassified Streptomyces]|uniref:ATP-binding protein n=1 Tax=Streptomyces sp. NBC_00060 TaxID=2975636 RepID=A0AAU2H508_9ACTN